MKQWPTATCRWHFALLDVSCRQSCHLLTPSQPQFLPSRILKCQNPMYLLLIDHCALHITGLCRTDLLHHQKRSDSLNTILFPTPRLGTLSWYLIVTGFYSSLDSSNFTIPNRHAHYQVCSNFVLLCPSTNQSFHRKQSVGVFHL